MKHSFIPKSQLIALISPEMIEAVKNVLLCKAAVQVVQPIVEAYQRRILEKYQFKNTDEVKKLSKFGPVDERVILDPSDVHSLNYADLETFVQECHIERDKAGLKVDRAESCPFLVADYNLVQAQNKLIDAMAPLTGIDTHTDGLNIDNHRDELIDHCIGLVVSLNLVNF